MSDTYDNGIERVQIITETRRAMRIYKCNVCENEFVVVNSGHKDPETCPWRPLHTDTDHDASRD